jgi:RNA-directed DNA polymerase
VQDVLVKVYDPGRLQKAWQQVSKNAGAAGIDQMFLHDFTVAFSRA